MSNLLTKNTCIMCTKQFADNESVMNIRPAKVTYRRSYSDWPERDKSMRLVFSTKGHKWKGAMCLSCWNNFAMLDNPA